MIYFDAAYIAKCYVDEVGSDAVRNLAEESGRVACCAHGRVELASTIHRQLREGKITSAQKDIIFQQFDLDEADDIWIWLPITLELLDATMAKFRRFQPSTSLRASDALHLECAMQNGFERIHTNDRHLLSAAAVFGLEGRDVIE